MPRIVLCAAILALGAGCPNTPASGECSENCDGGPDQGLPPRIYVTPPFGVGFDCVLLGCHGSQTLVVANKGMGVVRVTRIALTSVTSADFSLGGVPDLPVEIVRGRPIDFLVRFDPTDAVLDEGAIRITYKLDPPQGPDPEPVEVPLRTRSLGSPHTELASAELNFGYVPAGASVVKPVTIHNTSPVGSVLVVSGVSFESPEPAFRVVSSFPQMANSGTEAVVDVRFAPEVGPFAFRPYQARMHVQTNDGAHPDLVVRLLGTAMQQPKAVLEPEPPGMLLDVGAVGVGQTSTTGLHVRNLGGINLQVTTSLQDAAGTGFALEPAGALPPVLPLETGGFALRFTPPAGGPALGPGGVTAQLLLQTNDPALPLIRVRLRGFGILPRATPSVSQVDFGGIVVGWPAPVRTVELRNTGAGPLHVQDVFLEPGSDPQFTREQVPGLPRTQLPTDAPLPVQLHFAPVGYNQAMGALLFRTDDPQNPLRRVSMTGHGVSCEEGCPLPHATPACGTGQCTINSCDATFHDSDGVAINGCECGEDSGGDVGPLCAGGERNLGRIPDDGTQRSVSGTLHIPTDEDTYWAYADDTGGAGQLFGDDFDLRVDLLNTPAQVELCIRQAPHDVQGQGCGRGDEVCGLRSFRKDGHYGSDDSVDVTVRVRFRPGSAPMCGTYTLRIKNG